MEQVMTSISRLVRSFVLGLGILLLPASASLAQEISQSQLAAALDVINATVATKSFDEQLPKVANEVTNRLVRQRPDLHTQIANAVQAEALKLAVRRKDLDLDIARVYAKAFSEDELHTIATFLKSPAGQKYQTDGPKVFADTFAAVQRWTDRLGAELLDKAKEELKRQGIEL
jgi:hypothetical protein